LAAQEAMVTLEPADQEPVVPAPTAATPELAAAAQDALPAALTAKRLPPEPDPLPLPAREIVSPVRALVPVVPAPRLPARAHHEVSQALVPVHARRPQKLADQIISLCATPLVLLISLLTLPGQWLGNGASARRH
jgi:hypothetical protein